MSFHLLQNTEKFLVVGLDNHNAVTDIMTLYYKPLTFHYPKESITKPFIDMFVSSVNDLRVIYRILTHLITTNENPYFTKTLFKKYLISICKLSSNELIEYKKMFVEKCKWSTQYWMDTVMFMDNILLTLYI